MVLEVKDCASPSFFIMERWPKLIDHGNNVDTICMYVR